ncbi:MAG: EamA family transporter [Cytophagales bacterium]|nr:EamA family transporter [Cytophagales bacterium]
MNKKLAYGYIVTAAFLWGIIGLFVTRLYGLGLTPIQVVALRALSASFLLITYALFQKRDSLKIRPSDSKYFVGTGVFSFALFNWCLFSAIGQTTLSVAPVLLYTAPAFVTILSRLFLKEVLTLRKVSALAVTVAGCALVAGLVPGTGAIVSPEGLALGVGAGFFYALYSIFAKFALQKYQAYTVTLYTFLFAALAVAPFSTLPAVVPVLLQPQTWLYLFGLGFLSTLLAFLLYTKGLSRVAPGQAAIIATLEPVIASLVSLLLFKEQLNGWQYTGILLVISAVFLVQERSGTKTGQKCSPSPGR